MKSIKTDLGTIDLYEIKTGDNLEKSFNIDIGVYQTTIQVIVTDDIQEEHQRLGCETWKQFDGFCLFDAENKLPYEFYIVLKDTFTVGMLLHECIHCANRILGSRGVGLAHEDDEALTYLSQFIFEEILSKLVGDEEHFSLKI